MRHSSLRDLAALLTTGQGAEIVFQSDEVPGI
jgi:hypothetical protein